MKKLMKIESAKVDLTPNAKLSPEEMQNLTGGAGCICFARKFRLNGVCVCDDNPFGLCSTVNGCTGPRYTGPNVVVDEIGTYLP